MAIEHENDAKNILKPKEEVDKLLITDADLRVLVTLVRKTKDLLHQRRALASRMRKKIEKWVPANRYAEFLLIVGRYRFFNAEYRPEQEPWTIYHWHRRRGRWISHTTLVNEQNWKKLARELEDGLHRPNTLEQRTAMSSQGTQISSRKGSNTSKPKSNR